MGGVRGDARSLAGSALARWSGEQDRRALEEAYREEYVRACHRGVRLANTIGIVLAPVAVLLDYQMVPGRAPLFLWLRGAGLAILLVVQGLLQTARGRRHPHWLGVVGASSTTGLAILLTMLSGGYASPYNPSIEVVLFVTALLVPWSPRWTARVCGLTAAMLVVRAFVVPATGKYVLANVFAFTTASIFAVLASSIGERWRRRGFEVRWTLGHLVERLERAERLRSEFLGAISHELRTPLQVVLGFAEMLREPSLESGERESYIDRIERAGRELLDCIESTLTVARLEAGHEDIRPSAVWLPVFWRDLQDRCEPMPRASAVAVTWSEAPAVELSTDPRHLAVILRNLINNALKFTARGSVSVEVREHGDDVTFTIRDTGIGIPAEARDAIFEMFRQLDGADDRRFGGVGLGLYIVRRFVQQLGGTVAVASAVDVGSTFDVTLPKRLALAAGGAAEAPAAQVANGE